MDWSGICPSISYWFPIDFPSCLQARSSCGLLCQAFAQVEAVQTMTPRVVGKPCPSWVKIRRSNRLKPSKTYQNSLKQEENLVTCLVHIQPLVTVVDFGCIWFWNVLGWFCGSGWLHVVFSGASSCGRNKHGMPRNSCT